MQSSVKNSKCSFKQTRLCCVITSEGLICEPFNITAALVFAGQEKHTFQTGLSLGKVVTTFITFTTVVPAAFKVTTKHLKINSEV